MKRDELASAVPIHWHNGRPHFVRLAEIPEPWRSQFRHALIGSAQPALSGEGELAYASDWQQWIIGEWYGRGPSGLDRNGKT